ncbi:MAG: DUF6114 domain-containing protein [Thermoplasmata archaeon]
MDANEEGAVTRRPRLPIAPVAATLVAAAALIGYSGYWIGYALGVYMHCNPAPVRSPCSTWSFWGFDPTFFLMATLVGFAAGAGLTVLAFLLWLRPRDHLPIGALIVTLSTVSIVAYGGYFVGIAAGLAGGILALLYKPPRFREMAPWSGTRTTGTRSSGRPSASEERHGVRRSPSTGRATAAPTPAGEPFSAEAYAPLPPPRRPYNLPALGHPVPGPTPPASTDRAPPAPTAHPAYASLSDALSSRAGPSSPVPAARPVPTGPPPPHPVATAPGSSAARRTGGPPAGPPPALAATGAAVPPVPRSPAPTPAATPSGTGARGTVATPPAGLSLPWKCPRCGLTNAPWSNTCTQCKTPAPASRT